MLVKDTELFKNGVVLTNNIKLKSTIVIDFKKDKKKKSIFQWLFPF